MADDRKDLPPITSPNFLEKVREAVQTYLGNRGSKLDRGLTVRDLADAGLVDLNPRWLQSGGKIPPISGPGSAVVDAYEPDLTPSPTPTGFAATAAISNLLVECDAQTYTQGHGHAKSKLYGSTWTEGPLPVFADAVVLTEFSGTVASHATNPATTWHLWLTWVTVDGVESTSPAGGTNGVVTRTGEDVALLLKALEGQITKSALYRDLTTEIEGAGDGVAYLATQNGIRVQASSDGKTVIGGFGVMGDSSGEQGPTIDFGVLANNFYIAAPATVSGVASTIPFTVQATATTINGVSVPAGVYINDAYIKNGTITNAKIGNAAIDDAKITSLNASKLRAGSVTVGEYIQSTGYVSGSTGWCINGDGVAEFSGVIVRGTVYATNGTFSGTVSSSIINSSTINGATINSVTLNSGTININGDGSTGYGHVRSLNKWWDDSANGWVLARESSTGKTLVDIKAGTNRIWMSSWGDCGITFPGISMTDSGLTIDQINVIKTLNIGANAATTFVSNSDTTYNNGYQAHVGITLAYPSTVIVLGQGQSTGNPFTANLYFGTELATSTSAVGTCTLMAKYDLAAGTHYFDMHVLGAGGNANVAVFASTR